MTEEETLQSPGWRTIRVFISSTFRDFHSERDYLVKYIFPELREKLEPHRIHFVDIDLRWGVTEEQADNDKVLELCLDEITNCKPEKGNKRPFFIGMLGERYGWVPDKVEDETLKHYSWISDYPEHSLTALEIIHGILRNPPMHKQSFFYFREPSFIEKVPEEIKQDIVSEDEKSSEKLEKLKQEIRKSGLPVFDGYRCEYEGMYVDPRFLRNKAKNLSGEDKTQLLKAADDAIVTPEEYEQFNQRIKKIILESASVSLKGLDKFGKRVFNDLLEGIAQQYPEIKEKPEKDKLKDIDPFEVEQDMHERFAETRLSIFVGRKDNVNDISEYCLGNIKKPLVVFGPSGSGKTALLAKVREELKKSHPEIFIIPHFIGATGDSVRLEGTLRRLCESIQRKFKFPGKIPVNPTELPQTFRIFMGMVPEDKRVVIIIDALDQLDEYSLSMGMHWIPDDLPSNTRLVVSCLFDLLDRALYDELHKRELPEIEVNPLSKEDRIKIIKKVPSISAKTLDEKQCKMLLENKATNNPLYLQTALEELRGFGSFELLNERIKQFNEAKDVTQLFEQVLEGLEIDFGKELVEYVTCFVSAAREGLSENELLELLKNIKDNKNLQPLLRKMRSYLLKRGNLTDYYHKALDRAVHNRYQQGEDNIKWHTLLADYFKRINLNNRKLNEMPWQYSEAGSWKELYYLLGDLDFFMELWLNNKFEVQEYWQKIENNSDYRMADAFKKAIEKPENYNKNNLWELSILLDDAGNRREALILRKYLVEKFRASNNPKDKNKLAICLGNQAVILYKQGYLSSAMRLHKEEEQIYRNLGNWDGLMRTFGNQALIFEAYGDLESAMFLHKKEEQICESMENKNGLQISLGNQAIILEKKGRLEQAMKIHKRGEQICRDIGNWNGLQRSLGNQAIILRKEKKLDEAMDLYKKQERICRKIGNKDGLQRSFGCQANVLYDRGELKKAINLYL